MTAQAGPDRSTGWVWLALVAVVLLCPGSCGYFVVNAMFEQREELSAKSTRSAPPPVQVVPTGRIGKEVRDGDFAFVVTKVNRSKVAGDPRSKVMQQTAKGEYLIVHLRVTNIGDRAQSFLASIQKLDSNGHVFRADEMVSVWSNSASVEIKPGRSINALVAFDVPPGMPAGVIELHEAPMSKGAVVQL
jgi:hypothetical protein